MDRDEQRERQPVILVGVGGSDASIAALIWAAGEAHRRNARLRVLEAWQVYPARALYAAGRAEREPSRDAAAHRLAALHSIGRGAYDDEEVALTLGLYLLRHYPELLAQRFGVLPRPCDEHMLLALIATGRSLAKRSTGPDIARASVALLNDFRTGTLGRITLETVEQISAHVRS